MLEIKSENGHFGLLGSLITDKKNNCTFDKVYWLKEKLPEDLDNAMNSFNYEEQDTLLKEIFMEVGAGEGYTVVKTGSDPSNLKNLFLSKAGDKNVKIFFPTFTSECILSFSTYEIPILAWPGPLNINNLHILNKTIEKFNEASEDYKLDPELIIIDLAND